MSNKNKPMIEGVSIGRIKKARNLSGIWRAMGYETREEFVAADVSDARIARYLKTRESEKGVVRQAKTDAAIEAVERYEAEEGGRGERIEERKKEFEQRIEERVSQYLEDFEAPTVMDENNLKNLASAQLRLEELQNARLYYMARPMEEQASKIGRDIYKSFYEEEKGLLQQIRLAQKGMGIDRPTREDRALEVTGVDRVKAIVLEAKRVVDEELENMCHCGIRTAWVSDFFSETYGKFVKQCARCGGLIVVEHGELEWRDDIECPLGCGGVLVREGRKITCPGCSWQCHVGEKVEIVSGVGGLNVS